MDVKPRVKILSKDRCNVVEKLKIATEYRTSPTLDCIADFPPLPKQNCDAKKVEFSAKLGVSVKEEASFSSKKSTKSRHRRLEDNSAAENKELVNFGVYSTSAESRKNNCKPLVNSAHTLNSPNKNPDTSRLSPENSRLKSAERSLIHHSPISSKKTAKKKQDKNQDNGTASTPETCEQVVEVSSDCVANINSQEEYPQLSNLSREPVCSSLKPEAKTRRKPKFVSVSSFASKTECRSSSYRSMTVCGWTPSPSFSDILKATTATPSLMKVRHSRTVELENTSIPQKEEKENEAVVQQNSTGKIKNKKSKKTEEKKSAKKSQIATPLNLSDFIIRTNSGSSGKIKKRKDAHVVKSIEKKVNVLSPHNILDSKPPLRKRGKEREVPKKKQLSALKKIILKEREWKKNKMNQASLQLIDSSPEVSQLQNSLDSFSMKLHVEDCDVIGTVENSEDHRCAEDNEDSENHTADFLLRRSTSAIVNEKDSAETKKSLIAKELLHGRKFREYCNQCLSQDIDSLIASLLSELVRFQDRLYQKDPVKAKTKKRLVCGLKEVTKHLKLKKVKVLIVAPDVEKINSEGGLDDMLTAILKMSDEYRIPCAFGLVRRKIGSILRKKVPVCCVGIFNYEGAEEIYKQLMEKIDEAKAMYKKYFQHICDLLKPELITSVNESMSVKEKQELWKQVQQNATMKVELYSRSSPRTE